MANFSSSGSFFAGNQFGSSLAYPGAGRNQVFAALIDALATDAISIARQDAGAGVVEGEERIPGSRPLPFRATVAHGDGGVATVDLAYETPELVVLRGRQSQRHVCETLARVGEHLGTGHLAGESGTAAAPGARSADLDFRFYIPRGETASSLLHTLEPGADSSRLDLGMIVRGTLTTDNPVHRHYVDLRRGEAVMVLYEYPEGLDPQNPLELRLRRPDTFEELGRLAAPMRSGTQPGVMPGSVFRYADAEFAWWRQPAYETGVHRIDLEEMNGTTEPRTYTLQVYAIDESPQSVSARINLDEWVDGEAIDYLGDVDVFEFHAEEGQEIRLDFEDLSSDADWRAFGFNAEIRTPSVATPLLSVQANPSTEEQRSRRVRVPSTGLHSVHVNGFNYSLGHYRFQIRSWNP